jgi:hypothetical protein
MHAFGHPGDSPTWTSSAKDIVSCALSKKPGNAMVGDEIELDVCSQKDDEA